MSNVTLKIDAPFLFFQTHPVFEGIKGYFKFSKPTFAVHRGLDIPNPVPKSIGRRPVIKNLQISPSTYGIGYQHDPVPTVPVRVHHYNEIIVQGIIKIATQFPGNKGLGVPIVTPNGHVQLVIIVGHRHFGALGRMHPHLQFPLGKMRDALRLLPNRIIQTTVQTGGLRCIDRLQFTVVSPHGPTLSHRVPR